MKNKNKIEKQFDEYIKKTIENAAIKYKKEIANGTFIPLGERIKKQVECGELTQDQANDILELINKASPND